MDLTALRFDSLDFFLNLVNQIFVCIGIAGDLFYLICTHINLRKNLRVKIIRKYIGKSIHLPGTDRRISPVKRNVQRTFSDTCDRVLFRLQKTIISILPDHELTAHFVSLRCRKRRIQKTFTAFFRQMPFRQSKLIDFSI